MGEEILGSVSSLSLIFSNNKLPHYYKRMEMRFASKEEFLFADEIKQFIAKRHISNFLFAKIWGFLQNNTKPEKAG